MNDDAIFLTHRVDCIAGKPPPTKKLFHSADYVLFDKRWLAGDLPGTGSKTCTRGASNTTWAAAQPIAAVVTSESSHALRAEADFSASSQGFAVDQRAITWQPLPPPKQRTGIHATKTKPVRQRMGDRHLAGGQRHQIQAIGRFIRVDEV